MGADEGALVEEVGFGHAQEGDIINPTTASVSSSRSMLGEIVMIERTVVIKGKRYAKDIKCVQCFKLEQQSECPRGSRQQREVNQ